MSSISTVACICKLLALEWAGVYLGAIGKKLEILVFPPHDRFKSYWIQHAPPVRAGRSTAPSLTDILITPVPSGRGLHTPHDTTNYSKLRSYVFSASFGKQHAERWRMAIYHAYRTLLILNDCNKFVYSLQTMCKSPVSYIGKYIITWVMY